MYCIFSDWLGPDKEPHGGDGKVRYIGRFGEFAGKIATIREARFPINVRIYVHHLIMGGNRYLQRKEDTKWKTKLLLLLSQCEL